MIMPGIYLITILILLITFLLVKKSNKKQNLMLWTSIFFILLFCYNSLIVYIMSALNIKSHLFHLSACNLFFSLVFLIKIECSKSIQKYFVKKRDLFSIFILLFITIIIGYCRFGYPFEIVYETTDPGTDFWTSLDFFKESVLLNNANNSMDFSIKVFGSYVNTGIFFKICYPIFGYIDLYKAYILFDLIMLFVSGVCFYFLISHLCKKINFWIILIGTILYFLGYPLNNLIFGFFYCGHVVTLFSVLMLFIKFYEDTYIKRSYLILFITLLNIGVCFTYYLYMPAVFLIEFIYFICYRLKTKQKIFRSSPWVELFFTIFIPFNLMYYYFIIPTIGSNQNNIFYQLKLDGYFYNSGLSNFIMFVPIIIYYILYMKKHKKIDFEIISVTILTAITFYIIYLSFFGLAMEYYASKFVYMLWLVCFVIMFKLFNTDNKNVFKSYMITFVLLSLCSMLNLENKVVDNNELMSNKRASSNILDVYSYNLKKIKFNNTIFTIEEIEMLKKLYDIGAKNVVNNFIDSFNPQRIWLNAFFQEEKKDYPENELYNYIVNHDVFFEPMMYNHYYVIDHNGYFNCYDKYDFYVIFYRRIDNKKYENYNPVIPFDVQARWDESFTKNYVINLKEIYDEFPRDTCKSCEFIDFDDGLIIIRS